MQAFKITRSGPFHVDFVLEQGSDGAIHLAMEKGFPEFAQANWMGAAMQQGQWFFDRLQGLPWLDHPRLPVGREYILGSKPATAPDLIAIYAYQQLKREPRNEQIHFPTVTWDTNAERSIIINATVYSSDYGTQTLNLAIP